MEEKVELITASEYEKLNNSYENIKNITDKIRNELTNTVLNYLKIGFLLSIIDLKQLEKFGYKDIYGYAKENFNIGKTTTKNFINIYERFGNKFSFKDSYLVHQVDLQDDYKNYSMTQLVELLPVSDDELSKYNPDLSVNEIRTLKKLSQLTDFEKDFIDFVKESFNDIWFNVQKETFMHVWDLKEYKDNYIREKVIFSKGNYTFNITYKKIKINVSVKINSDYTKYCISLNLSNYGSIYISPFNTDYIDRKTSKTEIYKIIKSIVKSIDNDFRSKIDNFIASNSQYDSNRKKADVIFNRLKALVGKPIYLEDLYHGDFYDFIALDSNYYSLSNFIKEIRQYSQKFNHNLFRQSFVLKEIETYKITFVRIINDDIEIFLGNSEIYFRSKYSSKLLHFSDIFKKFPKKFSDYEIIEPISFFDLFLHLAVKWGEEQRSNHDDEYDQYEENEDDEDDY